MAAAGFGFGAVVSAPLRPGVPTIATNAARSAGKRLPNLFVFVIFGRMFEIPSCVAQLMVEAEDTSLSLSWIDAFLIVFFGYGFISAHRLGLYGELPRTVGWLAALGVGIRGYSCVASQFEEGAHVNPDMSALY